MSADIITHPRFNRPPVPQPNKRCRKGTVDLGKVRRHRAFMLATYGTLEPADDARPSMEIPPGWPIIIDRSISRHRLMRDLPRIGLAIQNGVIVEDGEGRAS